MRASQYDFDLFVIGAGSGGVRAARLAAEAGARVAIAEKDRFGGTCVIRGCIPKKFLVYASAFPEEFEDAVGYGWTIDGTRFDWPTLIQGKDRVLERLEGHYRRAVEVPGGTIFDDRAILKDDHTIHLAGRDRDVTAETILVATGGAPSRNIGIDGAELCITSDEAFNLKKFPKRIVVAGGGYIALEFAHIFHGLGAETTLVYRGDKVLRGFDEDLRNAVQASMQQKGVHLVLDTVFSRCEKADDGIRVTLRSGESLVADEVLLAIGRSPNTRGIGLDEAGVKLTERGHIHVDQHSRSSAGNIYAVGDVTGRLELTPVAIHEAICFVKTVFGGVATAPQHELVATAVFTRPEIGTVGLSEGKALSRGHTVDIYKHSFRPLKHTMSGRQDRMTMKLVVDAKTDRVLGCHIFGPEAAEMVQLVAIALKMGATKAQFDATVAVHPTMAEELVTLRQKHATVSPS
jgi:glutathione reductase (NADPH)